MYDSREKLVTLFAALSQHYFHFKYYEKGQRKDRCRDKVLFDWGGLQRTYKVEHADIQRLLGEGKRQRKPYDTLAKKLREFQLSKPRQDIVDACQVIISCIEGDALRSDLRNPFSYQDLIALQQALSMKASGVDEDAAILMQEVKKLLKLNDKTAIF